MISQNETDVIFDRCVIDILAYIHTVDPRKDIRSQFETAQAVVAALDLIIFVPIEDTDMIPGRHTNLPRLRVAVNDLLQDWIPDFDISVLEVTGTLSKRTQQVMAKIFNDAHSRSK